MKDDEERENNVKRNNYLLVMKLGKSYASLQIEILSVDNIA